jgi:Ornithine/acetylornithine aminotransferase
VKFVRFYQDRGLTIVKGEGQYVWDDKGQKYLDLHAGYGTAFLGHRNKVVIEYMQKQMERITNLTTAFDVPIRDEMLKELDKVKPEGMEYVYLLNSGTEGNELALKIAKKLTKRRKIVAFKNGFHGRTMGSLSVTWNRNYREQFGPMLQEVEFLDYNNVDGLKLINEETAGVIVEPVQGEGGVVPAKQEFMRELRTRTESSGSLLIVDEVQTGFGRTGEIWGHQHYGVKADIVVAGKAIGGGFPVSAVFLPEWIAQGLGEGDHGSTYGGNPLALAAVTAATKVLTNDSVHQKAKEKGEIFMKVLSQGLQGMKSVRE